MLSSASPNEACVQYEYYTLPFCAPKEEERKPHHLGEILVGDRMMKTLYVLPFLISFEKRTLCSYTLKSKEIEMFQKAIDEDYYFEMFYDDLPVHGFIGEKTTEVVNGANVTMYSLYTHYIFTIGHNGEQVLEIQWDHDPQSNLDISDSVEPTDVHFIYTVKWVKSMHASREHVIEHKESPHQHLEIRWFSIFNSIVTVLLLLGFLGTILMRILKNDFMRYARMEEESGLEMVLTSTQTTVCACIRVDACRERGEGGRGKKKSGYLSIFMRQPISVHMRMCVCVCGYLCIATKMMKDENITIRFIHTHTHMHGTIYLHTYDMYHACRRRRVGIESYTHTHTHTHTNTHTMYIQKHEMHASMYTCMHVGGNQMEQCEICVIMYLHRYIYKHPCMYVCRRRPGGSLSTATCSAARLTASCSVLFWATAHSCWPCALASCFWRVLVPILAIIAGLCSSRPSLSSPSPRVGSDPCMLVS